MNASSPVGPAGRASRLGGPDRLLIALAGLCGGLGVAASAAAAHTANETLRTAAQFLLFHAPAIIAVTALAATGLARPALARAAAITLLTGLALFCGDLALRALAGTPLFPMAAPAGGTALMLGWLLTVIAGLVPARA